MCQAVDFPWKGNGKYELTANVASKPGQEGSQLDTTLDYTVYS